MMILRNHGAVTENLELRLEHGFLRYDMKVYKDSGYR